ncbi:NUDIX domain-containing protein [Methanolapillus africanus]
MEELQSGRHLIQATNLGVIGADGTLASRGNVDIRSGDFSNLYYMGPGEIDTRAQFKSDALGAISTRVSPGAASAIETSWGYYNQIKEAVPKGAKDGYQWVFDNTASGIPYTELVRNSLANPRNREQAVTGFLNEYYGINGEKELRVEENIQSSSVDIGGYDVSLSPLTYSDKVVAGIDWVGRESQGWVLRRGDELSERKGRDFNMFLEPATSFVRGATFDNWSDAPGLLSIAGRAGIYGLYDANDVIRSDDSADNKISRLQNLPGETTGYYLGKIGGGMLRYAVDDPWAAAGGFLGPVAAKTTLEIAEPAITGQIRTVGRDFVPLSDLTPEKVHGMGGDIFRPETKPFPVGYPSQRGITIEQGISVFEGAKQMYPNKSVVGSESAVGVHVNPTDWGPGLKELRAGKSKGAGFFVGPNVSPRFARLSTPELVSLFPGLDLIDAATSRKSRPTVMFVESPRGIQRLPESVRYDMDASNRFIRMESDPASFWITQKMESNISAGKEVELEAVLPGGTLLEKVEGNYYTVFQKPFTILGRGEIFGQKLQHPVRVPIDYYRNTGQMSEFTRRRGTAVVETSEGVLLVRERNGLYNLPGGGVEGMENVPTAALRELREETGIKGKNPEFLFDYSDPTRKRAWEGGLYNNEFMVYRINEFEGVPRASNEVSGIDYYKPGSDLPLSDATKVILDRYYGVDELSNYDLTYSEKAVYESVNDIAPDFTQEIVTEQFMDYIPDELKRSKNLSESGYIDEYVYLNDYSINDYLKYGYGYETSYAKTGYESIIPNYESSYQKIDNYDNYERVFETVYDSYGGYGNYGYSPYPAYGGYPRAGKNDKYVNPLNPDYGTERIEFVEIEEEFKFDFPEFSDFPEEYTGKRKSRKRERRNVNPVLDIMKFMGF